MSTTLLEAAKTLVEAEKESRRASLAVREAHRSCSTHSRGYCADSVCIDAENALDAAVRAELEAQTAALAELRKLAAEATARVGGWLPREEVERLQKIDAAAKALAEADEDYLEAEEFSQHERDTWRRARDLEKELYRLVRSIPSTRSTPPSS